MKMAQVDHLVRLRQTLAEMRVHRHLEVYNVLWFACDYVFNGRHADNIVRLMSTRESTGISWSDISAAVEGTLKIPDGFVSNILDAIHEPEAAAHAHETYNQLSHLTDAAESAASCRDLSVDLQDVAKSILDAIHNPNVTETLRLLAISSQPARRCIKRIVRVWTELLYNKCELAPVSARLL